MSILPREHITILEILKKHHVIFILIGGVAVNYYGFNRPTGDMDVWLKPTEDNKGKLIQALTELDIIDEDIEILRAANFDEAFVFHIGTEPPFIIDFITKIVGVTWKDAWIGKTTETVDGISVSFININHLKANKLMSGRPKDLEDISMLNRIESLRKKNSR